MAEAIWYLQRPAQRGPFDLSNFTFYFLKLYIQIGEVGVGLYE